MQRSVIVVEQTGTEVASPGPNVTSAFDASVALEAGAGLPARPMLSAIGAMNPGGPITSGAGVVCCARAGTATTNIEAKMMIFIGSSVTGPGELGSGPSSFTWPIEPAALPPLPSPAHQAEGGSLGQRIKLATRRCKHGGYIRRELQHSP